MRPPVFATLLAAVALASCGESQPTAGTPSSASSAAALPTVAKGEIGSTLRTVDAYESNGNRVDEALAIKLSGLRVARTPRDPYVPNRFAGKGKRWLTATVAIRQTGTTKSEPLVEQFSVVDDAGTAYAATTSHPFAKNLEPDTNAITLQSGDRRSGTIAFAVPLGVKVTEARFDDNGFGPEPDRAAWILSPPVG